MKTVNEIRIHGSMESVYEAAQDIVKWPQILSHYRWVKVFEERQDWRHVEMAAWRDLFPVKWQSEQILYPEEKKVYYKHLRSTWTQGMIVWWHLHAEPAGWVRIELTHEMPPSSFSLFDAFRQHIVGEQFVMVVAQKTLNGIKRHVEAR